MKYVWMIPVAAIAVACSVPLMLIGFFGGFIVHQLISGYEIGFEIMKTVHKELFWKKIHNSMSKKKEKLS